MNRSALVFFYGQQAGVISENEDGYFFQYEDLYLKKANAQPISLTLPLTNKIFRSTTLFPFFDGLIPEGWLMDIAVENWKLSTRDRMGLLLTVCKDCIGAVSIVPQNTIEV